MYVCVCACVAVCDRANLRNKDETASVHWKALIDFCSSWSAIAYIVYIYVILLYPLKSRRFIYVRKFVHKLLGHHFWWVAERIIIINSFLFSHSLLSKSIVNRIKIALSKRVGWGMMRRGWNNLNSSQTIWYKYENYIAFGGRCVSSADEEIYICWNMAEVESSATPVVTKNDC